MFLEAGKGRYIELHPTGNGKTSPPGFPMNHLTFTVGDADATYALALSAGGVQFDIPVPYEEWDGKPLDVIMSGARPEPVLMDFLRGPIRERIELFQTSNN